jgi:23S rRNA pseudouridine2605 synthase
MSKDGRRNTNSSNKKNKPKVESVDGGIRLNKYIANAGICSRRDADIYITAGNVTVNGKTITEMGYKVKISDEVKFDGRSITPDKKEYFLLNKPKDVYVSGSINESGMTVLDIVGRATKARLSPIGKLERSAMGLVVLTNDGTLSKSLANPRHGIRQIYHVHLNKELSQVDLEKIRQGITLEDGEIKVDDVSYVENKSKREVGIEIKSTKSHIVQRLFKSLNYEIKYLDRVVFGTLTKKDLPRGMFRHLTKQEIINLGMI